LRPPLGDAKRLGDGVAQIGLLVLALQMLGLVRDHDIVVGGKADLDAHHRGNAVARVDRPLLDAHAARNDFVNALKPRDMLADVFFGPIGFFEVVEHDFEWDLHRRARSIRTMQ
jgi:hypothetical protein